MGREYSICLPSPSRFAVVVVLVVLVLVVLVVVVVVVVVDDDDDDDDDEDDDNSKAGGAGQADRIFSSHVGTCSTMLRPRWMPDSDDDVDDDADDALKNKRVMNAPPPPPPPAPRSIKRGGESIKKKERSALKNKPGA